MTHFDITNWNKIRDILHCIDVVGFPVSKTLFTSLLTKCKKETLTDPNKAFIDKTFNDLVKWNNR